MEIVILPPHGFLHNHLNHHRRRNPRNPNPNRSTRRTQPSPGPAQARPVLAQIRILRRGEGAAGPDPAAARPGPMVDGFYAGSSCATSPAPSELPLPAFFTRSCVTSEFSDVIIDNDDDNNRKIASDLRRVLKLC